MTPTALPHRLDRQLVIRARPETVFAFFTDPSRWARWWGAGSTIEPRAGGRVLIRYPNGVEVQGEVLAIEPPRRIEFTYGYAAGIPIPPGGSRVTITLAPEPAGTRLVLRHDFAEAAQRDLHVQGWRYQLALFANTVADEVSGGIEGRIDAWFAAWSEPDAARRAAWLAKAVNPGVRFRDRFSAVEGLGDLEPQLAAVHQFMPGSRLERVGPTRHCQNVVLADWVSDGPAGATGRGTNVFTLDADGLIEDVVGLWAAPSP